MRKGRRPSVRKNTNLGGQNGTAKSWSFSPEVFGLGRGRETSSAGCPLPKAGFVSVVAVAPLWLCAMCGRKEFGASGRKDPDGLLSDGGGHPAAGKMNDSLPIMPERKGFYAPAFCVYRRPQWCRLQEEAYPVQWGRWRRLDPQGKSLRDALFPSTVLRQDRCRIRSQADKLHAGRGGKMCGSKQARTSTGKMYWRIQGSPGGVESAGIWARSAGCWKERGALPPHCPKPGSFKNTRRHAASERSAS